MDSATYDSGNNVIVGVRGNRAFNFNATTGDLISPPLDLGSGGAVMGAFSKATVAYDVVSGKCFACAWNTPNFVSDPAGHSYSRRNIYRFNGLTLATDLVSDFATAFSLTDSDRAPVNVGIKEMLVDSGWVYCSYALGGNTNAERLGLLRFSGMNMATFHDAGQISIGGSAAIAYGLAGGNPKLFVVDQEASEIDWYDFTLNSFNTPVADFTKSYLAVGFAPVQQHYIVTDRLQFIYVYDMTQALVTTINTARVNFNGVQVRFNSVDGLLYIPGFADNTVIVLNPASNAITVKTGFDLPVDVVFTPTKKFAVQQGSVPIKEIT